MPTPHSSLKATRWVGLICGTVASVTLVLSIYSLARCEATGQAIYSTGRRGIIKEYITRESDPVKFQAVITKGWSMIMLAGVFTWGGFILFRNPS